MGMDVTEVDLSSASVIEYCETREAQFRNRIKDVSYAQKGMLNSEILLAASIIDELDCNRVIESGRARGHSTALLSAMLPNREIYSVEFQKNTEDAAIAERKLDHKNNIQLEYGDAREIIPAVADGTSPVIIDGPKGDEALRLALKLLSNDLAPLVFVHDLHSGTFHRDLSEMLFPTSFFSDDPEFVERFRELDNPCWEALDDDMQPYVRHGEHIDSYGFTLGVFSGERLASERLRENYYDYVDEQSASLAEALVKTPMGSFYRSIRNCFRYIK